MQTRRVLLGWLAAVVTRASLAAQGSHQSQSAQLAVELGQLLQQKGLTSIAAQHPDEPGRFVAAMYYPGTQLLVVDAEYGSPALLREQIWNGHYAEVYPGTFHSMVSPTR